MFRFTIRDVLWLTVVVGLRLTDAQSQTSKLWRFFALTRWSAL
jgi:hypothetical protein